MNDEDEETYANAPCRGRPLDIFYDWLENCQSLDENESSFSVAEVFYCFLSLFVQYIEHLFHKDPQNVELILKCPQSDYSEIWSYETARFIVKLLNFFLATLKVFGTLFCSFRSQTECNSDVCTSMTLSEDNSVEIMCAAHSSLQPVF